MEAEDAERPGDSGEVAETPAEVAEPMETDGDKQQVRSNDQGISVTLESFCTLSVCIPLFFKVTSYKDGCWLVEGRVQKEIYTCNLDNLTTNVYIIFHNQV